MSCNWDSSFVTATSTSFANVFMPAFKLQCCVITTPNTCPVTSSSLNGSIIYAWKYSIPSSYVPPENLVCISLASFCFFLYNYYYHIIIVCCHCLHHLSLISPFTVMRSLHYYSCLIQSWLFHISQFNLPSLYPMFSLPFCHQKCIWPNTLVMVPWLYFFIDQVFIACRRHCLLGITCYFFLNIGFWSHFHFKSQYLSVQLVSQIMVNLHPRVYPLFLVVHHFALFTPR